MGPRSAPQGDAYTILRGQPAWVVAILWLESLLCLATHHLLPESLDAGINVSRACPVNICGMV